MTEIRLDLKECKIFDNAELNIDKKTTPTT